MGLSEWVIYVSPRIVREPGLQLVKTVEHLLEMGDSHQAKGAAVRSTDVCMASGAWSAQKKCECAQRDGAQRGSAPQRRSGGARPSGSALKHKSPRCSSVVAWSRRRSFTVDQGQLRVRRPKTAGSQKSGRPKSVDSHTLQQTRQSPKKLPKFPNTKHWNSAPCRGPTMTSTCTRNTCIHNNQVPA